MKEISVQELKRMQDASEAFQLVDVREDYEVEICAISGSDHIPMGEVMDSLEKIRKDVPVVVHCRSGKRSAAVVNALMGQGYDNLSNLTGGILAWSDEIDTAMAKY